MSSSLAWRTALRQCRSRTCSTTRLLPAVLERRLFSAPAPARITLPPNLKIDPRSSFAPALSDDYYDDGDIDAEDEEVEGALDTALEESDLVDDYDDDDDDYDQRFFTLPTPNYVIPLPDRLHVEVHTLFAPEHSTLVGTLWLSEAVFGRDEIRVDLLKRAVDYYRNKARGRRKAATKTISQVSGSGHKLRQQKGTGRARVGHSRPPHFRGGAKAHGPKNATDYGATKLNKKVRRQALAEVLAQKLMEGNLMVVDQLSALPTHKTGDLARLLEPWGIGGRNGITALILDHYAPEQDDPESPAAYRGVPANLWVAGKNLWRVSVGNHHDASVYGILKHEKLILTLSALQQLEGRLENI